MNVTMADVETEDEQPVDPAIVRDCGTVCYCPGCGSKLQAGPITVGASCATCGRVWFWNHVPG